MRTFAVFFATLILVELAFLITIRQFSLNLTAVTFWIAAVSSIFVFSSIISTSMVINTFKSTDADKPVWKYLWNIVEVLWIVGGSYALIGAITSGRDKIMPEVVAAYKDSVNADKESVLSMCGDLYFEACFNDGEADKKICVITSEVFDILSKKEISKEDAKKSYNLMLSSPTENLNSSQTEIIRKLLRELYYLNADMQEISDEPSRPVLPAWTKWITAFSPHIFAFVFPLRLGRAIAAFAL